MNLNDPFGRVQSRQQKEYESLRDSLRELGVNTPEAAREVQEQIRRRGRTWLAFIVPITLLLALIIARHYGFVLLCGIVAAFWVIKTNQRISAHVQRYMQDELAKHNGPDPS